MNIEKDYNEICKAIISEHEAVFKRQDLGEVEALMKAIIKADRIFTMGVGREGIATRAFSMRLMHLGKEVHWVWDDTTPGMHENDLFIATSGSGKIGHIHYVVEQAKAAGTTVAVVTGAPREKTAKLADLVMFVPACVFNGTDDRVVESIQPMGSLFEQHLMMLFDVIILLLEKEMKTTHETMELRHRNIE
ncbi:MAG: 6-phospho-3-hexuloisomerase [Smithella sp.]